MCEGEKTCEERDAELRRAFYVAGLLPLFVCLSLITHRRTDH